MDTKIALSIVLAGALIAGAVYAGLTDGRRTHMRGCVATGTQLGQSVEQAEVYCAFQYKG